MQNVQVHLYVGQSDSKKTNPSLARQNTTNNLYDVTLLVDTIL